MSYLKELKLDYSSEVICLKDISMQEIPLHLVSIILFLSVADLLI